MKSEKTVNWWAAAAVGGLAMSVLGVPGAARQAQATVINGTTGSNTDSNAYSTTGNLDLSLGFFAEYLVVGGGGGGGSDIGGGGGAGRFIEGSLNTITSQSYTVTVGAGGAGGTAGEFGENGGDSSVFEIIAPGGGGGGWFGRAGQSGGSGGGGGANAGTGGAATAGTGAVGLGHAGGTATVGSAAAAVGAGGGGAVFLASQFIDGYNQKGGNGGTGATSTITGASAEYAGGGGGGINDDPNNTSVNGPGFGSAGGGNGAGASTAATDALANSGSGGGGGANLVERKAGGDGGSGIVVVRYQGDPAATGTNGGGPTAGTGTADGYTVHEFLATGDSTLDFSGTDMNTRLGATLTSGITGTGTLTFSGPGTLTLDAANTYDGSTSVAAGTLAIGAAGSIANTTGVAIASGATFDVSAASGFAIGSSQMLSGVGTVAGAISIAGTHSPGTSPGLQTFESDLSYSTGANVDWELIANSEGSAGTDYDQIAVGGNLDFAGTTTLDLIFNTGGSGVAWNNTFWDNDRAWLVWDLSTGSISNLGNLSINTVDWLDGSGTAFSTARPDASFSISQVGQDVSLVYTAVPEPGVLAMLPAAGLALVGLRRFRRRLKRKTTTRPLLWSPEPCLQSENTCRVSLVSSRHSVNAMKSLNICLVSLAVTLSWAAPLAAGPVFVVMGSDNTSLLTVELQNGKAVITNTQSLTPSVGASTFPVITYADDPASPFSVYALRNDGASIIEANATDGAWQNGSYGVLSGVAFDDIVYDGGQSQMYGTALSGGELWRINGPSSSALVGAFPSGGFFQEIAIDEATGQMYGTDLNGQALYTIDKTNATWSQISGFTAAGTGTAGSFTDLTFTLDGQLYGMNTTAIFEIDKATAVYNPTFFPIEDSSGNPVTVSGHFAAVPEPATFILTAIAVGAAAGVRLRQRLAAAAARSHLVSGRP